jgi:hypothetical protein
MKKWLLFLSAWFVLMGSGLVAAQVEPEAQALIDKAIVAHGGRAAIESIQTMTRLEVGRYVATDGKWYPTGWREVFDFAGRRYRNDNLAWGYPYAAEQETEAGAVSWAWDTGFKTRNKNELFKNLETEPLKLLLAPLRYAHILGSRTVFGGVMGTAVTLTLQNGVDSFTYLLADDGTILARVADTDFFATGSSLLFDDYRDVAAGLTHME